MNSLIARGIRLAPTLAQCWYAIPLRLIVGYGFIAHGYAKLARGPESFTNILSALGMFDPPLLAWATILIEIFGGLAVVIGFFIPLVSVPMMVVLLVAMFTVHLPNGFSSIKLLSVSEAGAHFGQPGYETDLLYLAALIALVLGGSGPLALDRYLIRPARLAMRSGHASGGAIRPGLVMAACVRGNDVQPRSSFRLFFRRSGRGAVSRRRLRSGVHLLA